MSYERVRIDGADYVREVDGLEVERRPATTVERAPYPPTPQTPFELVASIIREQAASAIEGNRAFISSTPTNAQVVAQVKALTRQVNGLIRLTLGQFDDTD